MSGPFKLRSGNSTPFKMMGSSSPMQKNPKRIMQTAKKVWDYGKKLFTKSTKPTKPTNNYSGPRKTKHTRTPSEKREPGDPTKRQTIRNGENNKKYN